MLEMNDVTGKREQKHHECIIWCWQLLHLILRHLDLPEPVLTKAEAVTAGLFLKMLSAYGFNEVTWNKHAAS